MSDCGKTICDVRNSNYKTYLFLKMQLIVLCLCICALSVVGQDIDAMRNMPKYDSRYDYLDVDGLFNSKRLVRNYVDCLVNGQRCTPEGKALKRLLPEALRTKCVRCTERQKKIAVKIIRRLKSEYPEEWAKLASKWDPTGDFTRYFEVFLANEQFNSISGEGNEVSSLPTLAPMPITSRPTPPAAATTTFAPPRPLILNRFDDEVLMESPSSAVIPTQPPVPTMRPVTMRPTTMRPFTMRQPVPPRPTPISWASAGSETMPTRFTLRPTKAQMPLPYSTAITFIDQIGIKIIRTTELVTDILKNTVRAVVGR